MNPASTRHPSENSSATEPSARRASSSTRRKPTSTTFSLAPMTTTTVVTTTTTTSTEYPPLYFKPPPIPTNLDPKIFPLADTPTPPALKKFCFDLNGQPTFFRENQDNEHTMGQVMNWSKQRGESCDHIPQYPSLLSLFPRMPFSLPPTTILFVSILLFAEKPLRRRFHFTDHAT